MKKTFLSILIATVLLVPALFFIAAPPTYAQSGPPPGTNCLLPTNWVQCLQGAPVPWSADNIKAIVGNILQAIMQQASAMIAGTVVINFVPSLGSVHPTNTQDVLQNYGVLGYLGSGMAYMYQNPPVTIQEYLATIHPITQTFAQTPPQPRPISQQEIYGPIVFNFWTASRNLAYGMFVVILIVIGLMLMFRARLNPRTTVTVTAAIPGIILSLILITFSLTFAALMVNFGQLVQEVFKNMLSTGALTGTPLLPDPATQKTGLTFTDIFIQFVNPFAATNAVSLGGNFNGGLAAVFLDLVIIVFAFIISIQLFITLLIRYLYILIKPIAAPIIFLFGAIPGRGGATVSWFKGYLADVLTFPLVLLLVNLGVAIRHSGTTGGSGDPFGLIEAGANVSPLLAIGILYIATKVPAFLEEIMDVKASPYVGKAGPDPSSMLKRIPGVGSFMK